MKRIAWIIGIVTLLAVLGIGLCVAPMAGPMRLRAQYEQTLMSLKLIDTAVTNVAQRGAGYPKASSIAAVSPNGGSPLPTTDEWGTPLRYQSDGTSYFLGSAGSDRIWEYSDLGRYVSDGHNGYDADIVVRNSVVVHGRYAGVDLKRFTMHD